MRIENGKSKKKKSKSEEKKKKHSWEDEIFMFMQRSLEAALNQTLNECFKDWK